MRRPRERGKPQKLDFETFAIGAMFDPVLEGASLWLGPVRNFGRGPGGHKAVSMLSPYVRRSLVTEKELAAALEAHGAENAEKYIREVIGAVDSRDGWSGGRKSGPAIAPGCGSLRSGSSRCVCRGRLAGFYSRLLYGTHRPTLGMPGGDREIPPVQLPWLLHCATRIDPYCAKHSLAANKGDLVEEV